MDYQEAKRPLRTKSGKRPIKVGKRPIKVGKRPIKEGKRPIKAMVLVGISVGCLMGCFRAPISPAMAENGPAKVSQAVAIIPPHPHPHKRPYNNSRALPGRGYCISLGGKSKRGLSKWGLNELVHNCALLPTIVTILRGKLP